MPGFSRYAISVGTGSALGSRLKLLSIENGSTRRSATSPHAIRKSLRGVRRKTARSSSTASDIRLAAAAILIVFTTYHIHHNKTIAPKEDVATTLEPTNTTAEGSEEKQTVQNNYAGTEYH